MTYQVSTEDAMRNSGRVMQETGAQAVKLEGGTPARAEAVAKVVEMGVPVMGHLGFTPQSLHALGGFRVQGREDGAAQRLLDDARRIEDAGAFSLVLELIPADLAERVTESLTIPTIGIGAGAGCNGQVLVLADLLGLNDGFAPKFLKKYASLADATRQAVRAFADDVRSGTYPDDATSF
jgi:3-methyl-2-oxobutanoate hydroxymethyltransferase